MENAFPGEYKLPDTGQTGDYTSTFGEDSDYLIHPPAFIDNNDGTVTDQVTGLMWQKNDGGEMTWDDARTFCENLSLGGYKDWRLPTSHELFNIVDLSRLNPALNTDYFPKTKAEYWWSVNQRIDDNTRVWVVNAGGGIGPHPVGETISAGGSKRYHVRCVRGVQNNPTLLNNGDGTVTDTGTGLMWQQGETEKMTWEEAIRYCEGLKLAGYEDWRLPNLKELRSINNDSLAKPSVDISCFTGINASKYWSSTTEINQSIRAWFVNFNYGLVSYDDKSNKWYVKSVRGGAGAPTGLYEEHASSGVPDCIMVHPVYPNPFNPVTKLSFVLSEQDKVCINVYNVKGELIRELLNGNREAGYHSVFWNAAEQASGTYFIQFRSGQFKHIEKCILVK